ncbi:MBL fold metallo-hydrolase [Geoglobus acetivorans]|uniref:Zinc metallohydrolase, glyoxalase II family n=1 Tax=Geoglobus acetivorans TaxID=565033 RepID=A0A0A7GCT6_GEOAI|nr:Zinc metallohydrolase, glyoxalase II family [Geoglobus acetivorans]
MKLVQVSDSSHLIPGATNVGVIRCDDAAILVDTGLDRESGRKILKLLEKNGLKLKAIINTHSHADHFGGNSYLVNMTDARVYAPEVEAGIIQYPYLEPLYLFSAHPVNEMMNRFLMARPSRVDNVIGADGETEFDFGVLKLTTVPLPGHSPGQIGVEADGVLYCADAVFSGRVIEKYRIPLFMDIEKQIETLSFLEKSSFEHYVPCHAEPTEDISYLADLNMNVIERVEEFILSVGGGTTEEILRRLCSEFEIRLSNFTEYSLMLAALKAYLSYLHNRGDIQAEFDGILYWKITR